MSEPSPSLIQWVEQAVAKYLPQAGHQEAMHWQSLSGDAGFRQYFRLNTKPPVLAVAAPPESENNDAFVAIANFLREQGLRTPAIIAYESDRGYMLVEDLGRDLLADHLTEANADVLYGRVLMELLRLQQLMPDPQIFPEYSPQKLRTESNTFGEWFAEGLLGYPLGDDDRRILTTTFAMLEESAAVQPRVVVHRDFHSRNLVYSATSAPGMIDFQDAVIGPLTYDLVSLLRDCYVSWPAERVRRWALAYAGMAEEVGLLSRVSQDQFLRWFDWMGLQRHIKVLGVFARLSLRDAKHGYLQDLPLVTAYVRSVAARYPELSEFSTWFNTQLLPLAERQDWYADVMDKVQ